MTSDIPFPQEEPPMTWLNHYILAAVVVAVSVFVGRRLKIRLILSRRDRDPSRSRYVIVAILQYFESDYSIYMYIAR